MAQAVAILPADDLSIAKAFFVDVLGFRVEWEATTDVAGFRQRLVDAGRLRPDDRAHVSVSGASECRPR